MNTLLIYIQAFLSWLRLAIYMAIVAVAILLSFHLKLEATPTEKKLALPFGLIFWFLGVACLGAGLNNYVKTVNRYSRRQALVQSGLATQVVSMTSAMVRRSKTDLTSGILSCGLHDYCGLYLVFVD